jgi:RNA polymerase sigma-70 factor (ECF subfamily)
VVEDADLVEAALTRGADGFSPIVERYRKVVFGIAVARLGNFHDAEDITQGVFLESFQRLSRLKDPERLGSWLRSITIHMCLNRHRGSDRQVPLGSIEEPAGTGPTPQAELERNELRERVISQISRLTPKQRETVTLYYLGEHQLSEVATIQGIPVGTVKRRLHDARVKLKKEMLDVVKESLRDEGPSDETTERVVQLLNLHEKNEIQYSQIVSEMMEFGDQAVEGLERILDLPHWPSRRLAWKFLRENPSDPETVIALFKRLADDPNKKIRKGCLRLLFMDVDPDRKRKEFLPLLIPLLEDRSARVRCRAAWNFCNFAEDVPLEAASRALAIETNDKARAKLSDLVLAILDAQTALSQKAN